MPDPTRTRLASAFDPLCTLPSAGPSPGPAPTREAIEAFTVAVTVWRPDLVHFVANILHGDVHRASDLVQDALLAAWRHLAGLREPNHLRAWLYRASYRNAISSIRRRGPRGSSIIALDASDEETTAERPAPDDRHYRVADDWADAEDLVPRMRACLPTLPPRYEQALRLHYLDSLGLREAASMLGVAIPTLKMRLHRGRALLKRRLVAEEARRRFRPAPGGRGASMGRPPPPPTPPGAGCARPPSTRPAPGRSS